MPGFYQRYALAVSLCLSAGAVQGQGSAAPSPAMPVQSTPAEPSIKFDVVSFRRTDQRGSQRVDLPDKGDSLAYHGQPVSRIIYFAYFSAGTKLDGAPDWVNSDLYEFRAKVAAEDVPVWQAMTLEAKRLMVRQVLANSLKLKVHANDKLEPVYELVVAPGGPKLKPHAEGEDRKFPDGTVVVGTNTHWTSPVEAYFQANTMSNLADSLSAHHTVDRDVVDKTGITGRYDFTLPVPYGQLPPEIMEQLNPPSIFSEVQKLGLKLVPGKAVYPGVVIDHIERPPED